MEIELKQKKKIWQSKTIIAAALTGLTEAGFSIFNPPQTKADWLRTGVVIGGSVLAGVFRKTATKNL